MPCCGWFNKIFRLNRTYADDVAITIKGTFFNTLWKLTSGDLVIVERWSAETSLSVNPSETILVPITNKKNLEQHARITVFGWFISFRYKVKYLGQILAKKLIWSDPQNVQRLSAFWPCSRFIGRTWWLDPKSKRGLYTGIVRPDMDLWWPRVELKTAQGKPALSAIWKVLQLLL